MTKHIFVTGGVVSSLGKGLTSASIGMLLEQRGLRVRMAELRRKIETDAGRPKLFVTEPGVGYRIKAEVAEPPARGA